MAYATDTALDFISIARQLKTSNLNISQSGRSTGSELIPTEVRSRMQREGKNFLRRPSLNGTTVDQEGLTNTYAVEPDMYYSVFPSREQMRQYAFQGAAAAVLVIGLIVTSVVVS